MCVCVCYLIFSDTSLVASWDILLVVFTGNHIRTILCPLNYHYLKCLKITMISAVTARSDRERCSGQRTANNSVSAIDSGIDAALTDGRRDQSPSRFTPGVSAAGRATRDVRTRSAAGRGTADRRPTRPYLVEARGTDGRAPPVVGHGVRAKRQQLAHAVVPRREAVRQLGQLGDGGVQQTAAGRRTRAPQAAHGLARQQPLVVVRRVQPLRQAAREPPVQVRGGRRGVEPLALHERLERRVRDGRLRGRRPRGHIVRGRPLLSRGRRRPAVSVGRRRRRQRLRRGRRRVLVDVVVARVRRRRQRPERVDREHFHRGRVHVRRVV